MRQCWALLALFLATEVRSDADLKVYPTCTHTHTDTLSGTKITCIFEVNHTAASDYDATNVKVKATIETNYSDAVIHRQAPDSDGLGIVMAGTANPTTMGDTGADALQYCVFSNVDEGNDERPTCTVTFLPGFSVS